MGIRRVEETRLFGLLRSVTSESYCDLCKGAVPYRDLLLYNNTEHYCQACAVEIAPKLKHTWSDDEDIIGERTWDRKYTSMFIDRHDRKTKHVELCSYCAAVKVLTVEGAKRTHEYYKVGSSQPSCEIPICDIAEKKARLVKQGRCKHKFILLADGMDLSPKAYLKYETAKRKPASDALQKYVILDDDAARIFGVAYYWCSCGVFRPVHPKQKLPMQGFHSQLNDL